MKSGKSHECLCTGTWLHGLKPYPLLCATAWCSASAAVLRAEPAVAASLRRAQPLLKRSCLLVLERILIRERLQVAAASVTACTTQTCIGIAVMPAEPRIELSANTPQAILKFDIS